MAFQGFFFFLQVMQERFRFLFGFVDDELSFFFSIVYEGAAGLFQLAGGYAAKETPFPDNGRFPGRKDSTFLRRS